MDWVVISWKEEVVIDRFTFVLPVVLEEGLKCWSSTIFNLPREVGRNLGARHMLPQPSDSLP